MRTAADAVMLAGRANQIAVSKAAGRRILNAYLQVQQDIAAQLQRLQRQIQDAQATGAPVNISWLYQANRLSALQQQVGEAVARFTGDAQQLTGQMIQTGAQMGADDAHSALEAMLQAYDLPPGVSISFNRLNSAALEDAANNTFTYRRQAQSGNRVRVVASLYKQMPADMQARAKQTIQYAVATGQHPSVTARTLAQQMGIARNKALTIARTEQLNAYRRSSIATFRQNSDVCEGWKWLTGPDPCPFCASMADTIHSLDEEMDSHPNCRCCASPIAKPLSDILAAYGIAA